MTDHIAPIHIPTTHAIVVLADGTIYPMERLHGEWVWEARTDCRVPWVKVFWVDGHVYFGPTPMHILQGQRISFPSDLMVSPV